MGEEQFGKRDLIGISKLEVTQIRKDILTTTQLPNWNLKFTHFKHTIQIPIW